MGYRRLETEISIHALLAESDGTKTALTSTVLNFYPRSPCGERLDCRVISTGSQGFLSTLSLRRATALRDCISCTITISIHALLAESDFQGLKLEQVDAISIHALLAESDHILGAVVDVFAISIHALLAESDNVRIRSLSNGYNFYPRSPCGERRAGPYTPVPISIFLSTLSLRRATMDVALAATILPYFYPRSPCGERRRMPLLYAACQLFLSTLSLRRATKNRPGQTHYPVNFYPRSPCGERLVPYRRLD